MSLGAKLTLWVLIPLLLVLIAFAVVTLRREREVHQGEVRQEAERIANTLAISITEPLRRRSAPDMRRILEQSALDPKRFGLAVYDSQGRPVLTWGLARSASAIGRQELTALSSLSRGVGLAEHLDGMPVQSHMLAMAAGGELLGGLKVSVSFQEIEEILEAERNYSLGMLAVVTIVLVSLISVTIRHTVTVPLLSLIHI